MFSTDPHLLLTLHHTHADDLRAEAAADRLARSVSRRRWSNRTRLGSRRRRTGVACSTS
ncbi:hypothetical protein [Plantactinospora sp. B5E13]|uniref:hypothetical protein n=1 Tax=unclassified Plantactinospora TaxID=2631981 RepID=UPI00325DF326